ncbi:hypothetical protein L083_2782 [Actinoplanes sp. N902-109]|nr:hypothetical protein L083_2782 [Actinoplanes sp. N902-109]
MRDGHQRSLGQPPRGRVIGHGASLGTPQRHRIRWPGAVPGGRNPSASRAGGSESFSPGAQTPTVEGCR